MASSLRGQNPLKILKDWLELAQKKSGLKEPWAMVLSSGDSQGRISSRVLLLKEIHGEELFFYTNTKSLKALQLEALPRACLNFYWPVLSRQIRLEGEIKKAPREQAIKYWKTRSKESQISQYISKQSSTLESREKLKAKWERLKKDYEGREIPCPPHWGGFSLEPDSIEFWIEQPHRLHERFLFKKQAPKKWTSTLLYP